MQTRLNYLTQQIFYAYIVLCLVIHVFYLLRIRTCACVHVCHRKKCKFRKFCPKYKTGLTQKDKEELYKLLDEYKMQDK